jgi:hypothetical protein
MRAFVQPLPWSHSVSRSPSHRIRRLCQRGRWSCGTTWTASHITSCWTTGQSTLAISCREHRARRCRLPPPEAVGLTGLDTTSVRRLGASRVVARCAARTAAAPVFYRRIRRLERTAWPCACSLSQRTPEFRLCSLIEVVGCKSHAPHLAMLPPSTGLTAGHTDDIAVIPSTNCRSAALRPESLFFRRANSPPRRASKPWCRARLAASLLMTSWIQIPLQTGMLVEARRRRCRIPASRRSAYPSRPHADLGAVRELRAKPRRLVTLELLPCFVELYDVLRGDRHSAGGRPEDAAPASFRLSAGPASRRPSTGSSVTGWYGLCTTEGSYALAASAANTFNYVRRQSDDLRPPARRVAW